MDLGERLRAVGAFAGGAPAVPANRLNGSPKDTASAVPFPSAIGVMNRLLFLPSAFCTLPSTSALTSDFLGRQKESA
jgi:hypothetical protein